MGRGLIINTTTRVREEKRRVREEKRRVREEKRREE
jgi:hypothetical protein